MKPVSIVQGDGWGAGLVWTAAENSAHYRDSIPGPHSL